MRIGQGPMQAWAGCEDEGARMTVRPSSLSRPARAPSLAPLACKATYLKLTSFSCEGLGYVGDCARGKGGVHT